MREEEQPTVTPCPRVFGTCDGSCAFAVRQSLYGRRWFVTIGHPGFNTFANNHSGYISKTAASNAIARHGGKPRLFEPSGTPHYVKARHLNQTDALGVTPLEAMKSEKIHLTLMLREVDALIGAARHLLDTPNHAEHYALEQALQKLDEAVNV